MIKSHQIIDIKHISQSDDSIKNAPNSMIHRTLLYDSYRMAAKYLSSAKVPLKHEAVAYK